MLLTPDKKIPKTVIKRLVCFLDDTAVVDLTETHQSFDDSVRDFSVSCEQNFERK